MGGNLAKSPLAALFYAALLHFMAVFLPFSQGYQSLLHSYEPQIPPGRYLLMVACCLWMVAIVAVIFSITDKKGFQRVLLLIPPCLGLGWVVPLVQQLAFGEVSGVMTQTDTLLRLVQGCAAAMMVLLLCHLLMAQRPASPAPKYKIKSLQLVIFLLVLPLIYFLIHFILGYFLAWRNDAFRAYYQGGGNQGIMHMIINMLLDAPRYAVFALLRGMLSILFSLPLLLLLPGKKAAYLFCHTALCLSGSLLYLLPSAVMPASVAAVHLTANAAILTFYGGLSGYLLHLCVVPQSAPAPVKAAGSKPSGGAVPRTAPSGSSRTAR